MFFINYERRETKGSKALGVIIGLAVLALFTAVVYFGGYVYAGTEGFIDKAGEDIRWMKPDYIKVAVISSVVLALIYFVYYFFVASKDESNRLFVRTDDKSLKFIYAERKIIVPIAGVVSFIVAMIAYDKLFEKYYYELVMSRDNTFFIFMIVVSFIHILLVCLTVFFCPWTMPAKGKK